LLRKSPCSLPLPHIRDSVTSPPFYDCSVFTLTHQVQRGLDLYSPPLPCPDLARNFQDNSSLVCDRASPLQGPTSGFISNYRMWPPRSTHCQSHAWLFHNNGLSHISDPGHQYYLAGMMRSSGEVGDDISGGS
jgi:hypothetical protein